MGKNCGFLDCSIFLIFFSPVSRNICMLLVKNEGNAILKKQPIRTQNDTMAHTRFENVYGLVNKRYVIFSESYGFKATLGPKTNEIMKKIRFWHDWVSNTAIAYHD